MFGPVREWTEEAACTGLVTRGYDPWCNDPELPKPERQRRQATARRICAACPVLLDCAADALHQLDKVDEHTMRGGMTPTELTAVAKKLGLPYRREAQHGTRSKYTAGCRCDDCRAAHRDYEHERRLRSRPRPDLVLLTSGPMEAGEEEVPHVESA